MTLMIWSIVLKNTINEALAKQKLNALNEIKKAETKNKRLINGQKILLNLFDDLVKAIFNNNKIVTEDNNKTMTEDNNKIVIENNNKLVIEYNSIDDDNSNDSDNNYNGSNNDDDYEIKQINNYFKMIDETKSFEEQINLLKGADNICEYWYMKYDCDKQLNLKIFKLKYAYILENLDENLFEEIFDHTFVTLANKLINTISKEENQILINDIKKNEDKIYERDRFKYIIQPAHKRGDLTDAIKIILEFNETTQLDMI